MAKGDTVNNYYRTASINENASRKLGLLVILPFGNKVGAIAEE